LEPNAQSINYSNTNRNSFNSLKPDDNTITGKGNVIIKATLTFTEPIKDNNPYGVGTLECTAVAKITSMNPTYPYVFGNGEALSWHHSTGDFANAKLTADLVMVLSREHCYY